jgi:hypothetical protein
MVKTPAIYRLSPIYHFWHFWCDFCNFCVRFLHFLYFLGAFFAFFMCLIMKIFGAHFSSIFGGFFCFIVYIFCITFCFRRSKEKDISDIAIVKLATLGS